MGLKYNKNDGQLLTSALEHNLQVADQIISDLQEGVNRLTSCLGDPFGGLSGKAYNAANTLFKSIIQPTLSKLKNATADVKGDLNSYKSAISAFDRYNDTVYDKEEIERTLDIKRQQKALVENQIRFFNDMLVGGLAKSAVENLQFEGKQLESVLHHYEEEIKKLETKLQILEETAWQTSSLFQDSLQVFQSALQGAKALRNGSFDASGNFKVPSNTDMNWYKQMIGQNLSSSLVSGSPSPIEQKYSDNIEALQNIKNLSSTMGISLEEAEKLYLQFQKLGKDKKDLDALRNLTEEIKLRSAHSDMTFDEYMEYCFNTFTIVASFGGAYGMAKTLGWGKNFLDWWETKGTTKPIEKPAQTPQPKLNFEGPPHIHQGKQDKHMEGSLNYKQQVSNGKHPSILTADPKQLLRDFSGKGEAIEPTFNKEVVDFGKPIGKFYNRTTGQYEETSRGTIHYDKNGGAHIVPASPKKGN